MEVTTHRSFGLVATITKVKKGEVITIDPIIKNVYEVGANFSYINMHIKGVDVLINTVTGESITRNPGDNSINNPVPIGSWRITLPEDAELVCYNPFLNPDNLPLVDHLEPVVLPAGANREMPHLTKFFLAAGTIKVGDKTFGGPKQIYFKSGTAMLHAIDDVYGFIVR
jgi:hypothetical protein